MRGKGSWLSLVQRFPLFTTHLLHVHYNVHFVQRTSWMFRQFYCSVYCTLLICSEAVQNQCTARSSYSALQCVSLHYNALSEDSPVNCSAMQSSHPAHCTAAHPVQYTVQPIWIIDHAAVDQSLVTNMHAVYTCIQRGWPRELVYVWIFTTMQYAWHCKFWWLYDLSRLISPWMVFIKATSSYQEAPSEILYFFWRAF